MLFLVVPGYAEDFVKATVKDYRVRYVSCQEICTWKPTWYPLMAGGKSNQSRALKSSLVWLYLYH